MNLTHTLLLASRPLNMICFSGAVTNQSVYLNGPGGQAGDGFPLPRRGYLTALHLWNGTTHLFDTNEIVFNSGERIAIYCQSTGSDFTVKVRVNGTSTALEISNVPFNATLFATVELQLFRD